ncbi:MAG TPA: hypothetical protein VMV06_12440 [Acidimicrobiales bacterium]|nr:hypothetical protein [Acidimicrobiales bacterium]
MAPTRTPLGAARALGGSTSVHRWQTGAAQGAGHEGPPGSEQIERNQTMGLMDKVKASAEIGLAKATEAGKAGQAKLDAAQAKHKADGLLRDLGAAVYADHSGRGSDQLTQDAERIVGELKAYEAEYGPIPS